jgi:DNA-binding response OmpR family regulator
MRRGRADAFVGMDPLDEFFRQAVNGLVDQLDDAMVTFKSQGDDGDLRRLCHSIKGSGGSFGYPLVSVLAAAAERASESEVDDAVAMLKAELSTIATAARRKHILVVDDDELISRLLKHRLEGPDRSVSAARDLAAARQLIDTERFDLIILDLVLTDGDGRHLLADLAERITSAGVPVIVLSASDAPGLRTECLSLGAEAFVTKPFDPDGLSHLVSTFLSADRNSISERAEFVRSFDAMSTPDEHITVASVLSETHGPGGRPSRAPDPEVLEEVERTIRGTLGIGSTVSRWGDAELAIVTSAQPDATADLLDRARLRLRTQGHPTTGGALVSMSAGVVHDASHRGLATMMSRARRLAGTAHDRGGDRVSTEWLEPTNGRVLLAEDDTLTAALVIHRLEREGFVVDHYGNGAEAAAAFVGEPFDLVVLDVQMPGLDGFEVLTRIRAASDTKVPVVMLTAVGSERDVVKGFELGADDYILKPFSPAELTVRLKRFMRAAS